MTTYELSVSTVERLWMTMICANCGRPIQFDKKKRVLHVEPVEYGNKLSVLFCYSEGMKIAKRA